MRVFSLRTALCLTLLSLATTTAFAGVRGKPANLKPPVARNTRVAQNDVDYSVNAVPVPVDVNVRNERVLQETNVNPAINTTDPNCVNTAPAMARTNYVAVPIMVMPMMAPAAQPMPMQMQMPMPMPMPMMPAPGCAACGGMSRGLSPAAAMAYDQAFGPGLYRSGAEVGQYHFPYYSYRRPWYFPGQPSFHRSTDYVW